MSPFPTKKVVTLDEKQTGNADFGMTLRVSDKEMEHLNDEEIRWVGESAMLQRCCCPELGTKSKPNQAEIKPIVTLVLVWKYSH